jgi:ornithine carbamoyltransferase
MNKSIIKISDLHLDEISHIFELADKAQDLKFASDAGLSACYSFEGNSIRTRATFIKALNDLRISPIEIPNILKTQEAVGHLAGYLDNWFDIFIIRDRDHKKLALFSESTNKPTINAIIRVGKGDMRSFKYCIIGPPTNVLNSWRIAGEVLGLDIIHVLPGEYMSREPQTGKVTNSKSDGLLDADVILTDAWPQGFDDKSFQLTLKGI